MIPNDSLPLQPTRRPKPRPWISFVSSEIKPFSHTVVEQCSFRHTIDLVPRLQTGLQTDGTDDTL
jgi:hypothetical protein